MFLPIQQVIIFILTCIDTQYILFCLVCTRPLANDWLSCLLFPVDTLRGVSKIVITIYNWVQKNKLKNRFVNYLLMIYSNCKWYRHWSITTKDKNVSSVSFLEAEGRKQFCLTIILLSQLNEHFCFCIQICISYNENHDEGYLCIPSTLQQFSKKSLWKLLSIYKAVEKIVAVAEKSCSVYGR